MMITRDRILSTLTASLESLDFVHAMWQGGAAAFNRVDEWSDIDLQLDVEDDRVEDAFAAVEQALESLSPILYRYRLPEPTWHGHSQAFYRLRDTSEFLAIDLVVIRHSSRQKFLQPEIHGNAVVAFDKSGVVEPAPLDRNELRERLEGRLEALRLSLELFRSTVLKELNRGNDIEALSFYQGMILRPLVEVLRIIHVPERHNFHTRYLYYDLPAELVERLEPFFFIGSVDDLRAKFPEAERLLRDALREAGSNSGGLAVSSPHE